MNDKLLYAEISVANSQAFDRIYFHTVSTMDLSYNSVEINEFEMMMKYEKDMKTKRLNVSPLSKRLNKLCHFMTVD